MFQEGVLFLSSPTRPEVHFDANTYKSLVTS